MLTEEQVAELVTAMVGTSVFPSLNAGYTYLGQLISHDLVPATRNPSRDVGKELWLRCLYDDAATTPPCFDMHGRFRTGGSDLPRDSAGVARIPEHRNDQNVIVGQLHLFWQNLHNALIDKGWVDSPREAESAVVRLYQLVVIEDYLRQLCPRRVFDYHFRDGRQLLHLTGDTLPDLFSNAAFRFGHTMVREQYRLQPGAPSTPVNDLFRSGKPLQPEHEIDWRLFFGPNDPQRDGVQSASGIDPSIGEPMQSIDEPSITVAIINADLAAGAGLPTGLKLVDSILTLHPDARRLFELEPLFLMSGSLANLSFGLDKLPLEPYLLLEAYSYGRSAHLGPLGALLLADVFTTSIREAPISVFGSDGYSFDTALDLLPAPLLEAVQESIAANPSKRRICMFHLFGLV